MCLGSSNSAPAAAPPPPPPAPPPVLEQSAPQTTAPKQADDLNNQAVGTKKYRTSPLSITPTADTTSTGLAISQ
jgi:hypothetical protein